MEERENFIVFVDERDESIVMCSLDKFELLNVCGRNNSDGVKLSCEDCGCISLDNVCCEDLRKSFLKDFNSKFNTDFKEYDEFEDYYDNNKSELKTFVENWKNENETHIEEEIYEFWTGNYYRCLSLENLNYVSDNMKSDILKDFYSKKRKWYDFISPEYVGDYWNYKVVEK